MGESRPARKKQSAANKTTRQVDLQDCLGNLGDVRIGNASTVVVTQEAEDLMNFAVRRRTR